MNGRHHVAALARDLAHLVGAAEGAGVTVPGRVQEHLEAAFVYLAENDPPCEAIVGLNGEILIQSSTADMWDGYREATVDLEAGEYRISLSHGPDRPPQWTQTPINGSQADEPPIATH